MLDPHINTENAPPLRVWLMTFFLVTFIFFLLWIWTAKERNALSLSTFHKAQNCLTQIAQQPLLKKYRVIALGTSLLTYGIEPQTDFAKNFTEGDWHFCNSLGGAWHDIAPALEITIKNPPTLLLIHEGLFNNSTENQWLNFREHIRLKIRDLVLKPMPQPLVKKKVTARPRCSAKRDDDILIYQQMLGKITTRHKKSLMYWIDRFQKAGTHVVLLDIPRFSLLESKLKETLQKRRQTLQEISQKAGIEYWNFSMPSRKDFYCEDEAHMNLAGRNYFAPLLIEKIDKTLLDISP